MTSTPPRREAARAPAANQFAAFDVGVLLAVASMWGLSFLFIKVAVDVVSPLWVVAARTSVGAVVLLAIVALRGRSLPRSRTTWRHLLVLAVLGSALPWSLLAWAEQTIPSGLAAVINALTPSSTLLVAATVGLERLTRGKITGLGLALAGTLLAVISELGAPGRGLAVLAVMAATLCYGAAAVYAKRRVAGTHPPLVIAAGQIGLAALLAIPMAALVGPTPDVGSLPAEALGSLLALGALGTGMAFLGFYTLIERVGATNATMITYLVPIMGLAAGALVLAEAIGLNVVAGTALIVGGIWLAQRERAQTPVEQLEQAST